MARREAGIVRQSKGRVAPILFAAAAASVFAAPLCAQAPLGVRAASGEAVTPVYEGWYRNADGSFSLSFGYFNRNFEEVVDAPISEANRIEPEQWNGGQPERFYPRRHWGVFAVRVPSDFPPDERIVWTLDLRGERNSIPGSLHPDWQIDALAGEAGSGNTPPVLSFHRGGAGAQGPAGLLGASAAARAGEPVEVEVWARDDGRASGSIARAGTAMAPVRLTWFKHSGPGEVAFDVLEGEVPARGGRMQNTVSFSDAGRHVIRVRANDASGVARAGHAQCCWTNAFFVFNVSPR